MIRIVVVQNLACIDSSLGEGAQPIILSEQVCWVSSSKKGSLCNALRVLQRVLLAQSKLSC